MQRPLRATGMNARRCPRRRRREGVAPRPESPSDSHVWPAPPITAGSIRRPVNALSGWGCRRRSKRDRHPSRILRGRKRVCQCEPCGEGQRRGRRRLADRPAVGPATGQDSHAFLPIVRTPASCVLACLTDFARRREALTHSLAPNAVVVLRQGRRARAVPGPALRRAPRVQRRDAAGGMGLAGALALRYAPAGTGGGRGPGSTAPARDALGAGVTDRVPTSGSTTVCPGGREPPFLPRPASARGVAASHELRSSITFE
jgi:hypothetical protein